MDTIASAVLRARSGLRDGSRPVVSLMFCGSSGVGKTELAKALASEYFGSEKAMVSIPTSVSDTNKSHLRTIRSVSSTEKNCKYSVSDIATFMKLVLSKALLYN